MPITSIDILSQMVTMGKLHFHSHCKTWITSKVLDLMMSNITDGVGNPSSNEAVKYAFGVLLNHVHPSLVYQITEKNVANCFSSMEINGMRNDCDFCNTLNGVYNS